VVFYWKKKQLWFCFAFVDFVRMQNCDCKQVKKAQWRPEREGEIWVHGGQRIKMEDSIEKRKNSVERL
jgi:hypothetical protein